MDTKKHDEALFKKLIEFGMCFVMKHELNKNCTKLTEDFIQQINALFNEKGSEVVLDAGKILEELKNKAYICSICNDSTLRGCDGEDDWCDVYRKVANALAQAGINKLGKETQ